VRSERGKNQRERERERKRERENVIDLIILMSVHEGASKKTLEFCSVAVCCSVLQRVAVCSSVLQCVAVCCSMLQCVAVCLLEKRQAKKTCLEFS